jgi:hypothetical protein
MLSGSARASRALVRPARGHAPRTHRLGRSHRQAVRWHVPTEVRPVRVVRSSPPRQVPLEAPPNARSANAAYLAGPHDSSATRSARRRPCAPPGCDGPPGGRPCTAQPTHRRALPPTKRLRARAGPRRPCAGRASSRRRSHARPPTARSSPGSVRPPLAPQPAPRGADRWQVRTRPLKTRKGDKNRKAPVESPKPVGARGFEPPTP